MFFLCVTVGSLIFPSQPKLWTGLWRISMFWLLNCVTVSTLWLTGHWQEPSKIILYINLFSTGQHWEALQSWQKSLALSFKVVLIVMNYSKAQTNTFPEYSWYVWGGQLVYLGETQLECETLIELEPAAMPRLGGEDGSSDSILRPRRWVYYQKNLPQKYPENSLYGTRS